MRRSSSFPSIASSHEARRRPRPRPFSFLTQLRRRRNPRPSPPANDVSTSRSESFGNYVREEMKTEFTADIDSFLLSSSASQLVTTDGPLLFPYSRRNLSLQFLEMRTNGDCDRRQATKQEILDEVRINWDPHYGTARERLPRTPRAVVVDGDDIRVPRAPRHSRAGRGRSARDRRPLEPASLPAPRRVERRTCGNRLTARDMRQIDPAFTAKPAIWVREDAMVVSLEGVRAIILHNKLFVFDADNEMVHTSVRFIRKRLVNNVEDLFMPFEFRALEGILIYICAVLEREFLGIEPELRKTLLTLPERINFEKLEQLRQLEQRLNHYYSRARKVQNALQSVLDEDEDMADMYLSEKRRNPGAGRNPVDHDEAEMLLETYLQNVDDLTSRAGLLNQAIDDTENLIEIHLDTTQNRLLLVDLIITVMSTVTSFGTMVTAMLGMNFPLPDAMTRLPNSQYYFYAFVGLMLTAMGITFLTMTRWCKTQGIYRRRGHAAGRRKRSEAKNAAKRQRGQARGRAEELAARGPLSRISDVFE
eukprot:GFKZ01011208.1.p1 GENE.GFKZ01011208.1~~GFKZ01011208.1.p1  ORF type:complete len:534 (-),score=55.41 GFKZ01011208.1:492-2093(-)